MVDILIVSLHADPCMPPGIGTYGGGHMYPKELLIGLSDKEYHISLITRKSYSALANVEYINKNCTIYRLDYGVYGDFDKKNLYKLRNTSYRLAVETINKYQIKFQIIHSIYWNSGQLALRLSRELNIPYVHSTISNGQQILLRKAKDIEPHRIAVEMEVFHNASFLFCITANEKEAICKYYRISADKIKVIGRPVNEAYRYPVHNDLGYTRNSDWNNSPYLLPLYNRKYDLPLDTSWWRKQVFTYVGRIDTNKGLSFIILAWIKLYKKYGNNCPPLWIIGGSPDEINDFHDDLSLEIESIEKTGKIIWWGTLDAEAISAVYLRTIAVIMHSKYEPGGRVSLEAMTSGVPVIATKCGFAKDMIIDWSNGFLIEYGDIESLSQKMECFIKQPYLSSALGISAAKTAELLSSEWDFLKAHIKVYEQAINGLNPKNERMAQIHSNFASDYINVYPYNNPRIDIELIKKYVNKFFTAPEYNVSSLEPQDHFFRWLITTNATSEKHYWVNQPYTYINLLVFTSSSKKFKYVIEAQNRYLCLKKWSSRIPTNILYFCDDLYFIISEESPMNNPG